MSTKNLKYYISLEYDIIVHKEEMDGETWFTAYCKELGMLSCYGKGDTQAEAIGNFIEEKNGLISYLFEQGKEIPEPKTSSEVVVKYSGFFNVRTSPIIHAKLVEQASEMDISMNLYVNQILAAAVEKKGVEIQMVTLLKQLHCKLDDHHYEVTKQLRYQNEISLDHFTWHAEYQTEGLFSNCLAIAS